MTFKEYVEKYRSDIAGYIEDFGSYDNLHEILFPNYELLNGDIRPLSEINYTPFAYNNDSFIGRDGGRIVYDLSQYIGENYYENEINERFFKEPLEGNVWTSILKKIYSLMVRYKYKWHALYESMLLDSEYNPLDNVSEIYSETITRTPDLEYTDNNSSIYGKHENEVTNNYGEQTLSHTNTKGERTIDKTNVYGEQKNVGTNKFGESFDHVDEINGTRRDTKETVYGDYTTSTNSIHKTYPFDLNTITPESDSGVPEYADNSVVNNSAHSDGETNVIGAQTNSKTLTSQEKTDTNTSIIDAHTDNETIIESAFDDSNTDTIGAKIDSIKSTDKEHTDNFTGIKTEKGEETTTITRNRHGNIGVTMSTQLIQDFRRIHYFDLIKIIGNDIINEIFDLNWGC